MKYPVIFVLLLFFSSFTNAASLKSYRSDFIKGCSAEGESEAVCACSFDKWAGSVQPGEEDTAIMMAKMVINNQPPAGHQMMAIQPLMMRFQQFGMNCAMTTAHEEVEEEIDMAQILAQAGMSGQEAADIGALLDPNISDAERMNRMKDYDKAEEKKRAVKQEQRRVKREAEEQESLAKQRRFDAEMERLYARAAVQDIPVQEFKKAFYLSQGNYINSKSKIDCRWNTLVSSVGTGPEASIAAHDITVGGADYDHPVEQRPYLTEMSKRYERYRNRVNQCD